MITNPTVYMVIRRSREGREWADVRTASGNKMVAKMYGGRDDLSHPAWAESNPVVRVGLFKLDEQ